MYRLAALVAALLLLSGQVAADPLPSWRNGPAKDAIIDFVERVSEAGGPDYVTPPARIAVFDNDGTLWSERPVYFQFVFAIDRFARMAAENPDLASSPALKAAARKDFAGVLKTGHDGLIEVLAQAHAGTSVADFQAEVRDWLDRARHPETGQLYRSMVFQPMLELLRYLREEGFGTYIVSGGGVHFMRTFAEDTYGVPPENVIGSSGEVTFENDAQGPRLIKQPELAYINDREGKPVAIDLHIGRRPIFAAGNSDGDLQMLQWTSAGQGPSFGLIVRHTDGEREFAYDRVSAVGRLDEALDLAADAGWTVVDMKADWLTVFPSR